MQRGEQTCTTQQKVPASLTPMPQAMPTKLANSDMTGLFNQTVPEQVADAQQSLVAKSEHRQHSGIPQTIGHFDFALGQKAIQP